MKYTVPIKSLKAGINPFDGDMGKFEAIGPQEVRDAAGEGLGCETPGTRNYRLDGMRHLPL